MPPRLTQHSRTCVAPRGVAWGACVCLASVLLCLVPALHAQSQAQHVSRQQPAASDFKPDRFWPVMGAVAAADIAGLYGLSRLWYSQEGLTGFSFYSQRLEMRYPGFSGDGWLDDWHTYVQQDKLGHTFTAWQLARVFGAYGRWSGLSDGHAGLFGGLAGTFLQMQVEVLDGFARQYGFSRTDALANALGGAMGGLQVAYPQRLDWFAAKYSYHYSPYRYREVSDNPLVSYVGNAIKDYDGASYWLVVRPERLLHGKAKRLWPDWLAVSVGYSADDITHAISGLREARLGPGPGRVHERVYLVGLDIDILASNNWPEPWQTFARALSFIRIPAPALSFGEGIEWHWLYY